jgi:hypothetical protein
MLGIEELPVHRTWKRLTPIKISSSIQPKPVFALLKQLSC